MKYFLLLLSLQLAFAFSSAQITFTREWVTGKRSSPYLSTKHASESSCKTNLLPAIKYLIEIDNILREFCGPQYLLHQAAIHQTRDPTGEYQLPWNLNTKSGSGSASRINDDESHVEEVLSQKALNPNGSRK